MKKTFNVILLIFISVLMSLLFGGCRSEKLSIETYLVINGDFAGKRSTTFYFPGSMASSESDRKALAAIVSSVCPENIKYGTKNYDGGIAYVFDMSFISIEDYKGKIKSIISKEPNVALSSNDSVLTKGIRLAEDFDTADLFSWLFDGLNESNAPKFSYSAEYTSNIVDINGQIFNTKSTININEVKSEPINSVTIETVNNKDGSFDRRITFSVPDATYNKLGERLKDYFDTLDDDSAVSGWTKFGGGHSYEILYRHITLEKLSDITNKALDTKGCSLKYSDMDNSSTPLAEQFVFEENLELLSFCGDDSNNVSVSYHYTLPLNTTHGVGTVLKGGSWQAQGEWSGATYKLGESSGGVIKLRVPDGIQYEIDSLDVTLRSLGNGNFERSMRLLFDPKNGAEGRDYAYGFFKAKKAEVTKGSSTMDCTVVLRGKAQDISKRLGDIFGGGNYLTYRQFTDKLSLVTETELTDSISLSYMLSSKNLDKPFTYTAYSGSGETINSINSDGRDKDDSNRMNYEDDGGIKTHVYGGDAKVSYSGSIPYMKNIIIYCVISVFLILSAMSVIIIRIKRSGQKKESVLREPGND